MIANAQQRKKTFQTNIFKFFLERASISNFCCATNQNNPRKYVSYDRSHLLQPCGKFLSWASPIPLGNLYPLAPPPPRNFHEPSLGGVWIFSGTTHSMHSMVVSLMVFLVFHFAVSVFAVSWFGNAILVFNP